MLIKNFNMSKVTFIYTSFFKYAYVAINLHLFLFVVRGEQTPLSTYDIQHYCDFSVSRYDPAGVLRFKTTEFPDPYDFDHECKVKVRPKQVPGSGRDGRVQLYFTEFNLPGTCSDLSVSILDGTSSFSRTVAGTPTAFCGNNTALIENRVFFNTSQPEFSVVLRWTKTTLDYVGNFVLKFSSYYEGPCQADDEGTVTCKNNRCISESLHCHGDIAACGGEKDAGCNHDDNTSNFWQVIWENPKYLYISGGVLGGCIFILIVMRFVKFCGTTRRESQCKANVRYMYQSSTMTASV